MYQPRTPKPTPGQSDEGSRASANEEEEGEQSPPQTAQDDDTKGSRRRSNLVNKLILQQKLLRITGRTATPAEQSTTLKADPTQYINFDHTELGPLPPPDYYYRKVAGLNKDNYWYGRFTGECGGETQPEDDPWAFSYLRGEDDRCPTRGIRYTPVGRNAVEMGSRFYAERNLFSYLTNTKIPNDKNFYDDDEVDLSCLIQKPVGYLILGKSGIGKTTLAARLADKLNLIHISPEEVVEYYRFGDVLKDVHVNEILESGGTIGDGIVCRLIQARVGELDVLHRGYVMDGFPMTLSEEVTVEDQLKMLDELIIKPKYVFLMNMQDVDLYGRRTEQKYDPETGMVYTKAQYSKFNPDVNVFPAKTSVKVLGPRPESGESSDESRDVGFLEDVNETTASMGRRRDSFDQPEEDPLDGTWDFPPFPPDIMFRLISRTEDNPMFVNEDLEQFRNKLPALQTYVEKFDKRNVLELDSYWAPSVIFKRAYDFLEACGVTATSVPVQILRQLEKPNYPFRGEWAGEDEDEEAPCPTEDEPPPIDLDWESAFRAVSIRGLPDPRFRWRITRWRNYCPVALKHGRSVIGKPELATAFLDKVFFLSNADAVEEFIFNPRPYLLPKMPTSPIKFMVLGHPLAGKTLFSKHLAHITDGKVIDMTLEVERRYAIIRKEYLYKKRLQYAIDTMRQVDRENHQEWKRQERARRAAMHNWVAEYIRQLAEAEIRAALDADRERRRLERIAMRKEVEDHELTYPIWGGCSGDDGFNKFCWKDFIQQMQEGKEEWTHQEWLQLAWDLFHERRLYYKLPRRKPKGFGDEHGGEGDEWAGELAENLGELSEDASDQGEGGFAGEGKDEFLGELEEAPVKPHKKRRRRRRCKKIHIKPEPEKEPWDDFAGYESSDIDPDDNEVEESIRMRYPTIPAELVEIIPHPSPVEEHNPRVEDVVTAKLEEDIKYIDTFPPEIYVEILRNAVLDAESQYREYHAHGPLTSGWVVENVMTDIDKFRAILRTPDVCPDQIYILTDKSENRSQIYSRLKTIFRNKIAPRIPFGIEEAMRLLRLEMEGAGEGGFAHPEDEPLFSIDPAQFLRDIDLSIPDEIDREIRARLGLPPSLPRDTLTDPWLADTPSNIMIKMMDAQRFQTPYDGKDTDDEPLALPQRKFLLERDQSKTDVRDQESLFSYESCHGDEIRRAFATGFKSINSEMTAFVKVEESTPSQDMLICKIEDDNILQEFLRHSRALGSLAYATSPEGRSPEMGMSFEEIRASTSAPAPSEEGMSVRGGGEGDNLRDDDDGVPTPDDLRSITKLNDIGPVACPDGLTPAEKTKCITDQQQSFKVASPKRRFFMQIRLFEEFWNMAIPVCNQQRVTFWEVGLIDEDNARQTAFELWDRLEARFEPLGAKPFSESELREEDEEIHESRMKWGHPYYEHTDPRGLPSQDSFRRRMSAKADSEFTETEEEELMEDRDLLAPLIGKPDMYNQAVKKIDAQRCFGDMKYYCPVTFMEKSLLMKGSPGFASKFRDRLYYCADGECLQKFVDNPTAYLPQGSPHVPPPPRIFITGSPGCGQEEIALKVAKEFNVCYINFRQRLHELIKARLAKEVGPNKTNQIIPRHVNQSMLAKSRRGDDLFVIPVTRTFKETMGEGGEDDILIEEERRGEVEELGEFDGDDPSLRLTSASKVILHPSLLHPSPKKSDEDFTVTESALRSLGILDDAADLQTFPIGSIERTERLTERMWQKLTKMEAHVKAFLENGIQLPDIVLDEYIAPLFKETPFDQTGFVLVGFPNSDYDVQYLARKKLIPEYVFVLECQVLAIRNRLVKEAVDKWHMEKGPPPAKKNSLILRHGLDFDAMLEAQKGRTSNTSLCGHSRRPFYQPFEYQFEGRNKKVELRDLNWSYNDEISAKITQALKHYHSIYSRDIRVMKMALNKFRVEWTSFDTNANLFEAKRKLYERVASKIKYRSSIFEDTVRLTLQEANTLLNRGVFSISRYQRWDPVELAKGNTAVNVWNSSSSVKIPILHRRYIYFLAGENDASHFQENCWELLHQEQPMNTVPAAVVVMGPPKSGKTTLAKKIAKRLGFVYISGEDMIERICVHAFAEEYRDLLMDTDPKTLLGNPQPMLLSNEILAYLRNGMAIPKFMENRVLDFALMQPLAQYHGVVFDDYPVTEEELQQLLFRGLVPSTVFNVTITQQKALQRVRKMRASDYNYIEPPEDGDPAIEYCTMAYEQSSETSVFWFQNEVQNLTEIDGTENPEYIYQKSAAKIKDNMKKMQNYLANTLLEKPSTLDGTCPLTSHIPERLSPHFGFFCPVALNDRDQLIRVTNITNLSEIVEYKGVVYLFSSPHNVKRFLANPQKYTPPTCRLVPPKELPVRCILTHAQFQELKGHWGFLEFDPVRYFNASHHFKGVEKGYPKWCVAYKNKIYCFATEDNLESFMRQPDKYHNQPLPLRIPRDTGPLDMEKLTPYCYLLSTGLVKEVKNIIKLTGDRRPRVPFMNMDRSAALFMGYHFKSQNMNMENETRHKYRHAMFEMMQLKNNTKKFIDEIRCHYGSRIESLPERLKKQFDQLLKMDGMPDKDKVLDPHIPGVSLSKDDVPVEENYNEIRVNTQNIKHLITELERMEKITSCEPFLSKGENEAQCVKDLKDSHLSQAAAAATHLNEAPNCSKTFEPLQL